MAHKTTFQKTDDMIEIGQTQKLVAIRRSPPGVYLGRGDVEVLLPNKYVPEALLFGEEIEVFVYTDSDDRPVATTLKPHAEVGQYACLKVVGMSAHGAFLDWGLEKDLFVPYAEQQPRMNQDEHHVVAVCLDERTQRVMGSSRLGQFLQPPPEDVKVGDKVSLFVFRISPLGPQVIVDECYEGLLYSNLAFSKVQVGDKLDGYIHRLREDGKVDIGLRPSGAAGRADESSILREKLQAAGGSLPIDDNSSPEEISQLLGMSKKAFKRGLGRLYRERKVVLAKGQISLAKKKS